MKKRILSLLLAAALLFSFAALPAAAEGDEDPNAGSCGTDVSWALDADCGVLTISGEGHMASYSTNDPAPWSDFADIIRTVKVEAGVTGIGGYAFQDLYELTAVSLPYGLETIGRAAFSGCESLEMLVIPSTVTQIGYGSLDISTEATVAVLGTIVTDQTEGDISVAAIYGIPDCGLVAGFNRLNEGVETANGCYIQNVYTAVNEEGVSFAENIAVNGDLSAHSFDEGVVAEEPTCAEDGFGALRHTCTVCGYTYDEPIAPHYYPLDVTGLESDHSYHDDRVEEWTVSCTEEDATGLRLVFAPECELELEYDFLNIYDGNGALLGRYTGTQLASLTVDILTPTATLRLETERSNATYGFRVAAAYGTAHIWDEGEVTTAPSVEAGEMTYTCTRCGAKRTEALDKTLLDGGVYTYSGAEIVWSLTLDNELTIASDFYILPKVNDTTAWGKYREQIRKVTLEGFMEIDYNAFQNYLSLTEVVIPDSVNRINGSAFYNCGRLKQVRLPANLIYIGNGAFSGTGLTEITLPSSLSSVGNGAFSDCSSLQEITLTSTGTSFGQVFHSDNNITRVNLSFPEAERFDDWYDIWLGYSFSDIAGNPLYYGDGAELYFNGEKITEVKIPGSYTKIPAYAFAGFDGLKTLYLPAGLETIGDYAFFGCKNLTDIVYVTPNRLQRIGDSAFRASGLPVLRLPESVSYVGQNIFGGLIVFEGSAPAFSASAFSDNGNTVVAYPADDASWTADVRQNYGKYSSYTVYWLPYDESGIMASGTAGDLSWALDTDGVLRIDGNGAMPDYSNSSSNSSPWYPYRSAVSSVELGEGVTSIGNNAFYECSSLRSITLPKSLTRINSDAFDYCSNLRSVTIPEGVTSIGSYAFRCCYSLTSVTLPESLTSIGSYAFNYCTSLMSVTIPVSVTSIGSDAFNNCSSLTSVTFLGSAPSFGYWVFENVTATVSYPADDPSWTESKRQNCGGNLTWTAEEIEHHYVAVVTDPTCTEDGYTTHTCSFCGDSYVDSTVPALGHDYETRTVEPTCTEQGFTGEVCTRCGDFIPVAGSEVPALGHSYSEEVVPPTCAADGYTRHTCDTCGDWYDDSIVPATGEHSWYLYYTSRFATCMEEGAEVWRCAACGCTETRATPKAEHSYSEYVTAPTCTSTGYTTFICVWCGNSHVGDFTAPSGHCWDDGMTVEEASCTEIGSVLYTCDCCGAERTVIVPATGHVVVIDPAVPATWDEGGLTEGAHCDRCGEVLKDQQPTLPLSEQDTILVTPGKAIVGRELQVVLSLRNNSGVAGMRLSLEYDSSVMTLTKVEDAGLLGQANHSDNLALDPYILLWANGEATENFAADGDAVLLTFRIAADAAPGEYALTVTYEENDVIDKDMQPVYFYVENATVTVQELACGDVNEDGSVDVVDCFFLLRYLADWNGYDEVNAELSDVNLDGEVDMLDAAILLRHVAQCVGFEDLPYLG